MSQINCVFYDDDDGGGRACSGDVVSDYGDDNGVATAADVWCYC